MLIPLFCIGGFAQSIDPVLMQEMGQRTDDEKIKVVVIMKSQYDRQQLGRRAANYVTRAERREFVVSELKQFAEASQYDLRSSLAEMERHDMTTAPKVIWMANALYFSATKQAINDLAMRRDVALIGLDEEKHVLFDEESRPASNTREITSNITQVNADQVWDLGFTGQGVVVAVIDSGVNYNHLDLADHLWDGGDEYPHHGYDFYNNDNDPMDDHSHGTHCAGTVCGDGTAGSQTGMAPDATLMCIKVLSSGGNGSAAVTCNAMQWAVEHGCDVFSMSLGWANSTITERTLFRNTCAAVLDAGVVGAIAAGNEGNMQGSYPIPNNVRAPGSCPPPYMDPIQANNIGGLSCTVCVGAVDVNDNAAYFTSRGPVTWSNTEFGDYPYTAGSTTDFGLIRPDVCAPGVNIKSAYYGSNNGYTTMSGTSMATPCTAGCISLLLSKNINATPEEICQVLEETAVSLADGKSNTFGYGRIDVLAAINALYSGPLTLESFTVNDSQGNNDGNLNAGESVTLSLTLKNESDLALNGATMTLTSESEYVTITDGTESLPSFNVGQTRTINNMFAFTLSNDAQAKRNVQFTGEIFAGGESLGTVRINVMVYGHILRFEEVTVLNDNNNNGSLEPGETANLHVTITNAGNDLATSVVGALSTAYPYLNINSNNKSFGSLDVNEQASANYSVTLSNSAPQSYTINFGLDLVDAAQKHTNIGFELWRKSITLTSNPTGAGTLSGGGYYGQGQTCTITAEPNDGYAFVSWSLDGTVVSYLPTYTFVVCDEANYVANFQAFNNSIIIGEGSTTNACLPSYSWFNYTLSQQIYTAEEMNSGACQISSVSFFNASGTTYTRNLTIYMVNTSKTAFESNYDWITVSEANQVFSGNVTRTAGSWNTIYFNTPFSYDGHSNVALIVDDNTGSYNSIYYNRAFATESNQSIYIYSDGTNYDPFSPTNYSGSLPMVKNDVVFGKPTYGNIVSVTANPTNGGTVTGGGNCYYGQPITLTATPNEGYVFNNWTKNGEVVSYLSTYQFNVTESATYVANFETIDGIAIGDATYSNYTLPTYYYNSLTEQIYTAAEMGGESTDISSVSFFNTGSSRTRNLSVYLAHTNKTSFESNTDWIAVTGNDLVFSGNVTFNANGWTSIYFGDLFEYNGTSNVVLVVEDHTNSYNAYTSFRTFDATGNQTLRIYDYNVTYDPTDPSAYTGTLLSVKNQVVFGVPTSYYTVTVSVNPAVGGSVSGGGGTYFYGQNCTLTAAANTGYCFYNWTMDGSVVSTNETYTFPVTGNMSLVANFGEPIAITATANPSEGGTVSGGGNYAQGHTCTLTATANDKYVFLNWTRNGSIVSWLSTYSFTVNTAANYVANFQRVSDGIVIGDAASTSYYLPSYTYYPYYLSQQIYTADEIGMACDISSVAFFNTTTSTPSRNFTVYVVQTDKSSFTGSYDWITVTEADKVFSGNVTIQPRTWTVFTFDRPFHYDGTSNLAVVVDDNTGSYGTSVPFRTYTTTDYQSMYYYNSSTDLDPLNPTNYGYLTTAKNQVIFGFPSFDYTVTVSSEPSYAGSVTGGGTFAYGQPCVVNAVANEGYCFYNWTENDEVVSTDANYAFTVTDNRNLVAHFGLPVTITVSAEPETGGTVSGDGLYAPGHICNLIATPNDGYTFISWTKDGEVVSYLSSYTFVVEGSADYVANFTQISGCIAIGNAFGVTPYLPSNSYYNYSVSQQIYTASEMGGANEISSIAFFNAGSTKTRNLTVYLKHTNKATFNSDNDWITVANSNKVFSGSVTLTSGNWTYIIFNQPFAYNGTSNLVLTVDDNTGDYSYGLNCRAFVADGTQALQAFSDDVNYNPKSPSSYTGSLMSLKNQVIFGLSGNIFNVFATADPAVGGTVSGGGVYQGGSTCTMTATPSNGYHFFYWKENNTVASMANPYEFTVESDRNLTAHFEQVTNHWTVDGSGYSDNMALTAVVQINEIEQRSDLLEVAAFCGTECRGTQLLSYFDLTDRYLVWMTVYGENGDELTFKVYDHRIGQELVMESPNLVFNTNGYGTPIEPYILNFTSMTTISQQLSSGWNWWSSYVEIDMAGLKASLVAAMPDSDDITVKSKSNGFTKWNGTMWLGALRVLDLSQMYMIQAEAPCTLELEGMVSDVGSHPITIINGWNWIGYPCSQSMSVNDALSGFTPEVNDQIKSRNNGYATYISYGSYQGWQGTLNTLEPGQGYMYNSNSNTQKTLVYQTNRSEMLLANITPENNIFVPKDENYAENMTITAVIELDGMELRGEDYELAAFVGNDCRGSVKLMYVEPFDRYVAFLTVYGEPSEKMHFVLTNGRTACKSSDCINYANDATIGTLDEPAVLHFGSTLGVNDLEQVLVNVYPNPSDGIFNIEGNGIRKVEVVDVLGQIVLSKEIENDFLQINLNDKVSGVYLLRVITDKGIYTDRLVRK